MSEGRLAGKVAVVTGAGRGIGRAIARALAAEGAYLALAARTEAELQAVAGEITQAGGQAVALRTDLTQEPEIAQLIDGTVARHGRLDMLINNAGIGYFGPLAVTSTEQWDLTMAVNVRAPFLLCRAAIPHLRQQHPAYIVNIGSVVSVRSYANQAAYGASKHALLGMSKALAKELQADGVRVHVICPGGVDTDLIGDARPDLDRAALIQPDELAELVVFLVTRRGNAIIDQVDVRRAQAAPWG